MKKRRRRIEVGWRERERDPFLLHDRPSVRPPVAVGRIFGRIELLLLLLCHCPFSSSSSSSFPTPRGEERRRRTLSFLIQKYTVASPPPSHPRGVEMLLAGERRDFFRSPCNNMKKAQGEGKEGSGSSQRRLFETEKR